MSTEIFHPLIAEWFTQRLGAPTEPQRRGWPAIAADRHTLIAAPTGSGKTLSAFMVCLDRLFRRWLAGQLEDRVYVVYVSPLKALSNDIERNLSWPLREISQRAEEAGLGAPQIRTLVRTGDTPAAQRASMLRKPPHILVTTPESLYLLLTSAKSREILRGVETVIVDEIHALARDKRGSHLSLTLERLAHACARPPVRIGLSATQRPLEEIGQFLIGVPAELAGRCEGPPADPTSDRSDASGCSAARRPARQRNLFSPDTVAGQETTAAIGRASPTTAAVAGFELIDVGHLRQLDLGIEIPATPLEAVCSNEQWAEVYELLVTYIQAHRSTLVFVNTRALAERVAHNLTELLGEEAVASHHGSLSREIRLDAEQRLKEGKLKAIVATASLEMGIDVGYIDLAVQIGSPRSIATFLQRIGRSGHNLGATPKGRLLPLTRDELIECLALIRAVRAGRLDRIEIPHQPLDILAQQIIAACACEEWREDELYALVRRAWPYRHLSREEFDGVVRLVSEGIAPNVKRGAHLHRDQLQGVLRGRRGARLVAITSGGAIPEKAEYRVVAEPDRTYVGSLDEDFAIESRAGDIILLGNTSWRVLSVRGGEMQVADAEGQPPSVPFWLGESPGRTIELSEEVSGLREEIAARLEAANGAGASGDLLGPLMQFLTTECGASAPAASLAIQYVQAQLAAMGLVPTARRIVFERFFDESGGMQLVVHAPLGSRINRAWGLAFRKRFCRSFDFELQAAADDDGLLLSLGPQHSFPLESLFGMLHQGNAQAMLEQALLAVPMFQIRWRWNVTRALAVLRFKGGKKVQPYLQKYQSEDLLAACFPETVGCLENHHGDVQIPDHPLVRQTMHDCLHEAMDLQRWLALLAARQRGEVEFVGVDTREPSPFSHEIVNANPYAFLDGAPLEERRTRAVVLRRGLATEELRELGRLDPDAIRLVTAEAWPLVRSADEMHDALLNLGALGADEEPAWRPWLEQLARAKRATLIRRAGAPSWWVAAERLPAAEAILTAAGASTGTGDYTLHPPLALPEKLAARSESAPALVELVRGRIGHAGPTTARQLGTLLGLAADRITSALEALEGDGTVLRGHYTATKGELPEGEWEWCDRRLLARIHRLTLGGLRKRIQPVEPADFLRFLVRRQRLLPGQESQGPNAVREIVELLQGFEAPAGAWERALFAARVHQYDPGQLDRLFLAGDTVWGRLRPPRRDEDEGPSGAQLTRSIPLAVMLRADLGWLLPSHGPASPQVAAGDASNETRQQAALAGDQLRPQARQVLAALVARGALFVQELHAVTGLLGSQLDEALKELAAAGLVTSDGFASIRAIVAGAKDQSRRRKLAGLSGKLPRGSAAGRWSVFPGLVTPPARAETLERWCHQLLVRYGVLFRDLLVRESAAPAWYELAPVLRRMERKGEIRGGRFVAGVSGEQFALETSVERLREIRDDGGDEPWVAISAADPLNLVGILSDELRIPATHKNALILHKGRCVATKVAAAIDFRGDFPVEVQAEMIRALRLGRRAPAVENIPARWLKRGSA